MSGKTLLAAGIDTMTDPVGVIKDFSIAIFILIIILLDIR